MRQPIAALSAVLALALAGCLDLEEDYSINPDGSGKVKIKFAMAPMRFTTLKKPPEELLKSDVRETLEKCEGIDAWADVSAVQRDDGKVEFKGIAYFKDFSKVKLSVMGMTSSMSKLTIAREGDAMVALLTPGKGNEPPPTPVKLSEEQILAKMKEERAKYLQAKPMVEAFLKDAKVVTRIQLPGALGEVRNFKKSGDRAVEIRMEGAKLLALVDGLVKDDAFLRKSIESGHEIDKSGPPLDDGMIEKLFGEKGAIKAATQGPLAPAFDYEAEAGKAREAMPELLAKFGAAAAAVAPPAGAGFKSVHISGVQWVHAVDDERGILPFSKGKPALSIALTAELGGSALTVKEGKLLVATADTGENLLPKQELPGPKVGGLKEVSGTLTYLVADKIKDVDLGIAAFKKGVKGKALGTEIEKVEESSFEKGDIELSLKIQLSPDAVESVDFYNEKGVKLQANRQGYSSSGGESTLEFVIKGPLPAKGKIVAKVYDEPKTYEAPFKITNVDLLGRPKK
jgi:hypothetical protein